MINRSNSSDILLVVALIGNTNIGHEPIPLRNFRVYTHRAEEKPKSSQCNNQNSSDNIVVQIF